MESIYKIQNEIKKTQCVLFVDDNKENFLVLKSFFKKIAVNLNLEFANFKQAEDILQEKKFDLVIMELSLPDLKAFLVGDKLINTYPHLRILLTTFHNETWLIQVAYNLRFNGYFRKQSDIHELLNAIVSLLNGSNYYDKEVIEYLNQTIEPVDSYFKKLRDDLKDVYRLLVRGVALEIIAKQLNMTEEVVVHKTKQIHQVTKTKSVVELIIYNYKKEVNSLLSFEEMMLYRPKAYLLEEPLYKTLGMGFSVSL